MAASRGAPRDAPEPATDRGERVSSERDGAARGRAGAADGARWLEQVEEGPGALLKRRFEREQARQAPVVAESPW